MQGPLRKDFSTIPQDLLARTSARSSSSRSHTKTFERESHRIVEEGPAREDLTRYSCKNLEEHFMSAFGPASPIHGISKIFVQGLCGSFCQDLHNMQGPFTGFQQDLYKIFSQETAWTISAIPAGSSQDLLTRASAES